MGKIKKIGEYSIGSPLVKPYERKRKRRRTKEEKELAIQKFENIINKSHRALHPILTENKEEISDKEIKRQKESLIPDGIITKCIHDESMMDTDGFTVCRVCGVRVNKKKDRKEKLLDLFCTHKEIIEQNGFLICVKCKEKVGKK